MNWPVSAPQCHGDRGFEFGKTRPTPRDVGYGVAKKDGGWHPETHDGVPTGRIYRASAGGTQFLQMVGSKWKSVSR